MIAILKIEEGEIKGWILASDIHDARRQLPIDQDELATVLYPMEFDPKPGKHELPTGHVMLVT